MVKKAYGWLAISALGGAAIAAALFGTAIPLSDYAFELPGYVVMGLLGVWLLPGGGFL